VPKIATFAILGTYFLATTAEREFPAVQVKEVFIVGGSYDVEKHCQSDFLALDLNTVQPEKFGDVSYRFTQFMFNTTIYFT
jgi:hypothetical protein